MRTTAYVDGFNLFYGLKGAGLKHCYWLDLRKLIVQYLKESWILESIKYFSAIVINNEEKRLRQSAYLDAIQTDKSIKLFLGTYQSRKTICPKCNLEKFDPKEKKTDVNIATQMMVDAYENNCDCFVLISADSDLVPPLQIIKSKFPDKKTMLLIPPKSFNIRELLSQATFSETLNSQKIEWSLLPVQVDIPEKGASVSMPSKWKTRFDEWEGKKASAK